MAGTSGRLRVGACLSLSGRFSPFGRQAGRGLEVWAALGGNTDVLIEDDASDVRQLQALLPGLAARCDLLLGPYSTLLMRAAGDMAADKGWLIWNHGGSGDDVQTAHPGHVVSVLTPTSRYMEPFLNYLAAEAGTEQELRIAHGKGRFGLQVASGADAYARSLGFSHARMGPVDEILGDDLPDEWTLITAGTFEDDTHTVIRARGLAKSPRITCAVAAGVQEFVHAVERPDGTFGIAQWFSGGRHAVLVGPTEHEFLSAYSAAVDAIPDYPAIQAVATASISAHCAQHAGSFDRDLLWPAAAALEANTLYGTFRIDQTTGAQIRHRTVLTRWLDGELTAVPDNGSEAEFLPVVAAIVTSEHGVLVGRRNDAAPLWTFIAGEIAPGESPADAAIREVHEETGVLVTAGHEIGRRVHPVTGRTMIYVAAQPTHHCGIALTDPDELAELRWVSVTDAEELMQPYGIFGPVRDYLVNLFG